MICHFAYGVEMERVFFPSKGAKNPIHGDRVQVLYQEADEEA